MGERHDEINNTAIEQGRPCVDMLNQEELNYIHWCHETRVFPQGWTGEETAGNKLLSQIYPDGTVQPTLF